MLCFLCLAEAQNTGKSIPSPAITVYNGHAMCLGHVNLARGLPAEYGATPLSSTSATVLGTLAAAPAAPSIPTPAPAPTQETAPEHETCTNCNKYAETHYQPEVPHCACGAPLIEGTCEATLTEEDMAAVIESIAPRR